MWIKTIRECENEWFFGETCIINILNYLNLPLELASDSSMACMNWAKVWGPAKSKSVVEADDELEDGSGGWFCAILKYSCLT